MKTAATPIHFAGSQLDEVRHVCAFFNSDDEKYRVLLPFIKDGFECGDKAIHVVNPDQHHDHQQRLVEVGIDPTAAQQSGQLEIQTNTETYLRDGRFDQDRMLEAFEQLASGNANGGFPLSRIVCQMDWAAEGRSHVDDLIAFESRVNDVWCRHDDAVICVYDLAKFSGDTVIDIIRTHLMIIIAGRNRSNRSGVSTRGFPGANRETGSEPSGESGIYRAARGAAPKRTEAGCRRTGSTSRATNCRTCRSQRRAAAPGWPAATYSCCGLDGRAGWDTGHYRFQTSGRKTADERTQLAPDDRNHSGDALERYTGGGDRLLQCSFARLHWLLG